MSASPFSWRFRLAWPALAGSLLSLLGVAILLASERTQSPVAVAQAGPGGAENLALAPALSFTDDSSSSFPIRGENMKDGRIASDRPTVIFFGTSHCWNTNREAERFVEFYRRAKETARFLVVDLDHPSRDQKALVERFTHGLIPTLAFLDRKGNVVYDQSGETSSKRGDTTALEEILKRAKGTP